MLQYPIWCSPAEYLVIDTFAVDLETLGVDPDSGIAYTSLGR
jgi:hypothetical protein